MSAKTYTHTPIPLIKCEPENNISEVGFIKVKLHRHPTSPTLYIEYKMALFENGKVEQFLLLVPKFKNYTKARGSTSEAVNIH